MHHTAGDKAKHHARPSHMLIHDDHKKKSSHNFHKTYSHIHVEKPSVVTDYRTEALGEPHRGSFYWLDSQAERKGRCKCRCLKCRGKPAILEGNCVKIRTKISIIEYFKAKLAKSKIHPNNPAIIYPDESSDNKMDVLTYNELDLLSNVLGNVLKKKIEEQNLKNWNPHGDIIIAFCMPANVRYISLLFATLKLGAGFFPISMDLPVEKILSSIEAVQPMLTIITREYEVLEKFGDERFSEQNFEVVYLEDLWDEMDTSENLTTDPVQYLMNSKDVDAHTVFVSKKKSSKRSRFKSFIGIQRYDPLYERTIAIISPSNGSEAFTGVRYRSQPIFNLIVWEWKHFKMAAKEKTLLQADYDTVTSLIQILSPLLKGDCLVLMENEDLKNPVLLLENVKQLRIVRLDVSPSILHSILRTVELIGVDEGRRFLETVRFWFCIGGSMTSEMGELFFQLLPKTIHGARLLINVYGNDEDMGVISYQVVDSAQHVDRLNYHCKLPVGSPIQNVQIYLVDENMKVVRGDQIGEICISGPVLGEEFTRSLTSSTDKIIPNPFRKSPDTQYLLKTGDYGRVIKGEFGHRYMIHENWNFLDRHAYLEARVVELDEIEAQFKNSGLMTDCCVLCYRSGHEDQRLLAFCCCSEKTFPKVIEYLRTKIPEYMIPDLIETESVPYNSNGCVNDNYLLRHHYDVMLKRKEFFEWKTLGAMTDGKLHAVKVLFQVIFSMVGVPIKDLATIYYHQRFRVIPGSSYSKTIFVVYELHRNGFPISVGEFMNAKGLDEIAQNMVVSRTTRGQYFLDDSTVTSDWRFRIETLTEAHQHEVLEFLAKTLTRKGSLDYYAEVKKPDIKRFVKSMWPMFVDKGLSKIVKSFSDGKIIGVLIAVNWHDEVAEGSVQMTNEISYRYQLMQILEDGFGETSMSRETTSCIQIIYATLNTTHLNHMESYTLIESMIAETVRVSAQYNFEAVVFTTYEFYVTDKCVNDFGFKVIRECQLNQFVAANGTRPFYEAPDSFVASLLVRRRNPALENDLLD